MVAGASEEASLLFFVKSELYTAFQQNVTPYIAIVWKLKFSNYKCALVTRQNSKFLPFWMDTMALWPVLLGTGQVLIEAIQKYVIWRNREAVTWSLWNWRSVFLHKGRFRGGYKLSGRRLLILYSSYHTTIHTTTHQHSQYCETGEPPFVIATILNPHIKFISWLLKVGRIKLS